MEFLLLAHFLNFLQRNKLCRMLKVRAGYGNCNVHKKYELLFGYYIGHERLPVNTHRARIGLIDSYMYNKCQGYSEDLNHLFIIYSESIYV